MASARGRILLVIAVFAAAAFSSQPQYPAPRVLPAAATAQLAKSLEAASGHNRHVWRDTAARNADGTVNAYIEISRGDRQKWELDMRANTRALDRVIPESIGGYPVNYGFVPQTVSYDGDPFDALVLGPPITGGDIVRGIIVGVMHMDDEKGWDSKVVLSRMAKDGKPLHQLTSSDQRRMTDYFKRYKEHQPGAYSKVPGWGSVSEGLSYVTTTHAFFLECRERAGLECEVSASRSPGR